MTLPIRPARESDHAFVVDAWKRSYEGAAAVKHCDPGHYRTELGRAIQRVIRGSLSNMCGTPVVRVAYDPKDDDHLVGFACFSQSQADSAELHYIYVKRDFRGQGIARALLEGVPIKAYTFLSPTARPRKGWRFTPRFTI